MLTPAAIAKVAPGAKPYADELASQMAEAGIMANANRASMFLGQIAHESRGFTAVVESMAYKPARLLAVFRGRNGGIKTLADAERLVAAGPRAVADFVYGGDFGRARLGNTVTGDGSRFIGRGLKQLTGRDNYRRFSRAWLGDESLLEHPERVADADGAVASAIWFWLQRGLNQVADRGSVEEVTRLVNGGQVGIDDRKHWTRQFRAAWRERPDFANVISGSDTVPG